MEISGGTRVSSGPCQGSLRGWGGALVPQVQVQRERERERERERQPGDCQQAVGERPGLTFGNGRLPDMIFAYSPRVRHLKAHTHTHISSLTRPRAF